MEQLSSVETIATVIQLAVAPVFLLAGIAGLLNVLSIRLGRVVDRVRVVETRLFKETLDEHRARNEFSVESHSLGGLVDSYVCCGCIDCLPRDSRAVSERALTFQSLLGHRFSIRLCDGAGDRGIIAILIRGERLDQQHPRRDRLHDKRRTRS